MSSSRPCKPNTCPCREFGSLRAVCDSVGPATSPRLSLRMREGSIPVVYDMFHYTTVYIGFLYIVYEATNLESFYLCAAQRGGSQVPLV